MLRSTLALGLLVLVGGCAAPYGETEQTAQSDLAEAKPARSTTKASGSPVTATPNAAHSVAAQPNEAKEPTPTPTSLAISWNQKSPTAKYSLDVILKDGTEIAPCVNAGTIDHQLAVEFAGNCSAPKIQVDLTTMHDVRICWTENDDWTKAECTDARWDGGASDVHIDN